MPTTTWGTARQDIARELGLVAFATTTNITTNTSIVSTNLADDYDQDDLFIGWYVLIRNDSDGSASTNTGTVRRITDYTASSGTLTVAGAALSAEDEAVDCELYRFHPDRITDHYNRARNMLFPYVSIPRDYTSITTGQLQQTYTLPTSLRGKPDRVYLGTRPTAETVAENEITDPSFEDWSSTTALSSWTLSGTGSSVNQEEQTSNPKNYMVLEGQYSARLKSNASDETTLLQTVTPSVSTERVEANLTCWVYNTQTADAVTLRVVSTDSAAHGGTGWEQLSVSTTIGEATTVSVGVAIATATAGVFSVYVDEIILILGQTEPVDTGWEQLHHWNYIQPVNGVTTNSGKIEFPYRLREQASIRVIGRDVLSSCTTDASTFEAELADTELLYNEIRRQLCLEASAVSFSTGNEYYRALASEYDAKVKEGLAIGAIRHIANPRPNIPDM